MTTKPANECACQERMGNDFWSLPRSACLYHRICVNERAYAVASHERLIEQHAEPAGEVDPFRGGLLV
jgi:hypothetical protein